MLPISSSNVLYSRPLFYLSFSFFCSSLYFLSISTIFFIYKLLFWFLFIQRRIFFLNPLNIKFPSCVRGNLCFKKRLWSKIQICWRFNLMQEKKKWRYFSLDFFYKMRIKDRMKKKSSSLGNHIVLVQLAETCLNIVIKYIASLVRIGLYKEEKDKWR